MPRQFIRIQTTNTKGQSMPEFTITRHIDAPVETVWELLHDFGDIHRWSGGVKASELTTDGPVVEGSSRHCDFALMGSVDERVDVHVHNERLTVDIYKTYKLPISGATADFNVAPEDDGTELTLHYDYTPNVMGRLMRKQTDKQMRKGMGILARDLQNASESLASDRG
jgi:uncharacterized protein YndB with AHSA1/START domain